MTTETENLDPPPDQGSPQTSSSPKSNQGNSRKTMLIILGVLAAVALVVYLFVDSYYVVSTDDAYVNSHVTFVAPQVSGKVEKVLVQDNNTVHKGDLLVEIDKRPFQVQVDIQKAEVDSARASLLTATAQIKSEEVTALSLFYKLYSAINSVDSQLEQLNQNMAALNQAEASFNLAKANLERDKNLLKGNVISSQAFDTTKEQFKVAQAVFNQALQAINGVRTGLGLPVVTEKNPYQPVPPDFDQTASSVQEAQTLLMAAAEQIGVTFPTVYMTPKQLLAYFESKAPNANAFFAMVLTNAPLVKLAQAKLEQAQGDLQQAILNLKYCDVVASIDGAVTSRNVNAGNYVQTGQQLMAIRSLTDIWVDANFKETQLADLRIGQPVDLVADMYGGKHVFQGRISGFTMGTGSTLALLPAQNATGNFVKVVQRLPVRIDVLNYDPTKLPLFVGLSMTPNVHIRDTPTGPDAGEFLQNPLAPSLPAGQKPATPAN